MLVRRGPLGGKSCRGAQCDRFYLEDVGKVAAQCDLELEDHRLQAVVDDVEILVQAATDRSAEGGPKVRGGIVPSSVRKSAIGEKDAGRVVADGAAVQQFPRLAVGIDPPTADDTRIEEIKALFARPVDLPVLFADRHRLALADGDLRWADLDLYGHEMLP